MLITRRSVVKGLGSMAMASVLSPFSVGQAGGPGCCAHDITLNVILHGLFVMDFQADHIDLLAPCISGHIYRAGNWDAGDTYELGKLQAYALKGVPHRSIPPRYGHEFLAMSSKKAIEAALGTKFSIDHKKSRINVSLPFPEEIRPLRCLKTCHAYGGDHAYLIKTTGLSLCPVLIYRNASRSVKIQGLDSWKPHFDKKYKYANLHFWAEPPGRVDPFHAQLASSGLKELVGLKIDLIASDSPPIDCWVDIPGVHAFEEQGWAEWASGGEGTRPVNCNLMGFV